MAGRPNELTRTTLAAWRPNELTRTTLAALAPHEFLRVTAIPPLRTLELLDRARLSAACCFVLEPNDSGEADCVDVYTGAVPNVRDTVSKSLGMAMSFPIAVPYMLPADSVGCVLAAPELPFVLLAECAPAPLGVVQILARPQQTRLSMTNPSVKLARAAWTPRCSAMESCVSNV